MPNNSDLDKAEDLSREFLSTFFRKIKALEQALLSTKEQIQEMREASCKDSSLFKPLFQVALVKAIHFLIKNSDMDEDAIYRAINKIDWSYVKGKSQWEDIVFTRDGTILTGNKVQERLRDMIIYFVLGKSRLLKLENGENRYNDLLEKWKDCKNDTKATELPEVKNK